jgi:hydrogenase nickel incorporation protein HypB
MFRKADLVLITKVDLLPHLPGVSIEKIEDALGRVMPRLDVLHVSAQTGAGVDRFVEWLGARRVQESAQPKKAHHHPHAP